LAGISRLTTVRRLSTLSRLRTWRVRHTLKSRDVTAFAN